MKKLYHYTSINNLGLILSTRSIRFGRLDKVNDPSEGESADFHNLSNYIFVSCWTINEEENLALWNMYTPQMRGVRLEMELPIFNSYKIDDMDNFLFSESEYLNEEKCIFLLGGQNIPCEMEYTDEMEKLTPKIRSDIGLNLAQLGKFKRTIWSFEKEYRYRLDILPIDPNIKSEHFPDRYNHLIEKNIAPSIDGYFININEESFRTMKILMSPKIQAGDYEIITALAEKFNPNAKVFESKLKGLIR